MDRKKRVGGEEERFFSPQALKRKKHLGGLSAFRRKDLTKSHLLCHAIAQKRTIRYYYNRVESAIAFLHFFDRYYYNLYLLTPIFYQPNTTITVRVI